MKLGKREIDGLSCPPGKRDVLVFGEGERGFGLRVTAAGAKIFIFQYKRGDAVRRMVIGRYGEITAAEARKIADKARREVADGGDPMAMREAEIAAERSRKEAARLEAESEKFTLEKLVDQWAATGLQAASASHRRDAPASIKRTYARHLATPADSLKPADMQAAIDSVAKKHPVAARRARDYAKAMANWGLSRQLVTHNPFASVRIETAVVTRERALSDAELGAVWRAVSGLAYPFGPLLRLLILTLQRRTEVAAMRWPELDADFATWTLPATRSKNRKGHIVPLPEPARVILRELSLRPMRPKQPLIFTTTGTTPVSGFSNAIEQIQAAIKRELPGPGGPVVWQGPWTLHDFRRTGVTTLARLGIMPHVADRMLNHVQGTIRGVAAVYQRHDFLAEREAAARLWADHVLAVAAAGQPEEKPGNVVRLVRTGAPARPGGKR